MRADRWEIAMSHGVYLVQAPVREGWNRSGEWLVGIGYLDRHADNSRLTGPRFDLSEARRLRSALDEAISQAEQRNATD